jgi:hypothetical protein
LNATVITISIFVVLIILSPFFLGEGGYLASSSAVQSADKLDSLRDAILKRYIEDEQANLNGALSDRAWGKRKQFLVNRYIDASRRRDFLLHSQGQTT